MRYAFLLELDGSRYAGTQAQANAHAFQDELAGALTAYDGSPVGVRLASRLDAGVSAELLPAHADLRRDLDPRRTSLAVTARLGQGASVRAAALVADGWHATHHAIDKTYRYRLRVREARPALDPRCWWLRRLDHPQRLAELAALIIGRRDLRRFACLRHDGSDEDDGTREIIAATWESRDDCQGICWELAITGTGFLYKQVRGLVGAMVHVAQGRRTIDEFAGLVDGAGAVPRIGNIAPPEGLRLERVRYQPEPAWVFI